MTERMRSWMQAAEMGFLRRVAGVSLWDKMRSAVICEELEVETLLLCIERSQLVWASGKDSSWLPPCGGVPAMSSWKEAPGQTQVQVERLYLCTGLGTPWDPWSELTDVAGEREVWGPCRKACLRNLTTDKQ